MLLRWAQLEAACLVGGAEVTSSAIQDRRVRNLRRDESPRSRLVVEPTPEVPLPPEFVALQKNIEEQQRQQASQVEVGSDIEAGTEAQPETQRPVALAVKLNDAPAEFVGDQEGMPALKWYRLTEPITSPSGQTYKAGTSISNGELIRFGYSLPEAATVAPTAPTPVTPTQEAVAQETKSQKQITEARNKEISRENQAKDIQQQNAESAYSDFFETPEMGQALEQVVSTKSGKAENDNVAELSPLDPASVKFDESVIRQAWKNGVREFPGAVRSIHSVLLESLGTQADVQESIVKPPEEELGKVSVAGAVFDVVRRNPDGTLRLKSEGGEFDIMPGETWSPIEGGKSTAGPPILDTTKTPTPAAVAKEVPDVVVQTRAIATGKKSRWVRRNGLWYKAKTLRDGLETQKTPLEPDIGLAKLLDEIALNPKPWQRVRQLEASERTGATVSRLTIPAINRNTRGVTDLSPFRIPLPRDVLLVDSAGNSPDPSAVRLTYRTSGKGAGLRLYVDNKPAYQIDLPKGSFEFTPTGISVDQTALLDTSNWKLVDRKKNPTYSPFTLERDQKAKPVAQKRAATSAVDAKGDLLPLSLTPGAPIAQGFEFDEARTTAATESHNSPSILTEDMRDLLEQNPTLVESFNAGDLAPVVAAFEEQIKRKEELAKVRAIAKGGASAFTTLLKKMGYGEGQLPARQIAEDIVNQLKADEPMLTVPPGGRLVPTRIISSGTGKEEILAILTQNSPIAPNGKPSNLNWAQWRQVRTPEFKAWFGNWENDPTNASKVVDENGEPKVVYHGTRSRTPIQTFQRGRTEQIDTGFYGRGHYFTDNPRTAEGYAAVGYATGGKYGREGSGGIYPVFLNIRRPATHNQAQQLTTTDIGSSPTDAEAENITRRLTERGFDGVFVAYRRNPAPYAESDYSGEEVGGYSRFPEIVAFNPTQIKSAIANVGTFDPTNPDIAASLGGQKDTGTNQEMLRLGRQLIDLLPPQYLEGFTLNIVERETANGPEVTHSGSFWEATQVAEIMQSATDPDTAIHEISHRLEGFLNSDERTRNNNLWRQELDREIAGATGERRELLQAIKDANGLTSLEYLAQSKGDTSMYYLTNPSEFFAHRFTDQARAELKRDSALDYVRGLLRSIVEAVKRLFGRGDFYDGILRKFLAGDFQVDARTGPLFERNKYGVAASLDPIASRPAYEQFMRGRQTATPEINRFKNTVVWFQNESVAGGIANQFQALPRGVKSELSFLRERLDAMAAAVTDLGGAPNVAGDIIARAQALAPDPIEQNQLVFSVVNNTMEVQHAARALEQRAVELGKELTQAKSKDTRDSAFADLANDILSKAVPAQRTLLRQSNMTVFLEGGTIGAAETAQAIAATASYANLAAKVADANNGISRKQRILEYQQSNANQASQFLAIYVLSDPRTVQDYRDGIAARGVRGVVMSEVGGTITYEDPLAPTDRSKDVTVAFSLDAAEVAANQQKLLTLAGKMDQYVQTGTDELRKAAYVDELDRIWNYHLSTRNFPTTGKLLFGKGDVFRWLTFGGRVAIPDYITKFIGGEPARKLSIALKNYSEARQQAMNHQDRLRQNIYATVVRAAKAHKITENEWMRRVGKPILDSHAAFGAVRPIKSGMKLPGNIVVFRSDMEAIEAQAAFFRVVAGDVGEMSRKLSSAQPSPVLIYEQATKKRPAFERKPLQASRLMLPRSIGRQWRNLAPKWLAAQKAGNTAVLVDMVDDPAHWYGFLSHLRAYEDPSYVVKSDFEQAYRMVQEEIYNGNVPADFDSLVTMVDRELGGTVPRADIESKMLGEFTEVMRLLNNPVTPSEVDISIISAENFMNNPRGQSVAPPAMYDIGLETEGSQFSLISQVAEVYGQRYLNMLLSVRDVLDKKATEYQGKVKGGVTRKQVEKDSREAQIQGDTFVNYQELKTLQQQLFHQLQQFRELKQSKQGFDVEMSRGLRLLGNIVGSLLQTPGVLFRNSLGGPIRATSIDMAIGYSTSLFGVRLPIISTALNTSKNALLFARGARQLALGSISHRLAKTAAGKAALQTLQQNPTFWNSIAQWLASVMNRNAQAYQKADDLGLLKEAPLGAQIANYFRLFTEGGRIIGDDPKAVQKIARSFESLVGIFFEIGIPIPILFSRKVLPATVDDALNQASSFFTDHVLEFVSKNALKSLVTRASLNARTDVLTPQEVLGRTGATAKQLEWLRLIFDQNNISLDRVLIEYYQNVEAAKASGQNQSSVQFLTPQQHDSVRLTFANELNRAGFMTRPALFAKSAFARAFGTFFGYPAQTNTQFSVFMSKHSRDTRTLAGREGFLLAMQIMLAIIIFGTLLAAPGADLLHRLFYNRERQIPQLSSAKDGWDLARIAFMQSGALMPTVGGVFNYMIEQTKPGMGIGGSGVSLLPLSLFNGTMDALRAAYQTGDVIRPAVSFVRRWIPNSQIVLNRTPFLEGSIEGGNVRAILDRNAPTSIERRGFGFGGNIKRSPTSDDIDGIVNAIYRGDSATARQLTDKAVEERRASGIAKPENSVYSSVFSRNPYNSLFGKTLTEGERSLVLGRLKTQDRARVLRAEDAFQSYASSTGRNEPTFISSRGTTRSRSRGRSSRSRRGRFSIRSRNRFRIRGLGRRNRRLVRV